MAEYIGDIIYPYVDENLNITAGQNKEYKSLGAFYFGGTYVGKFNIAYGNGIFVLVSPDGYIAASSNLNDFSSKFSKKISVENDSCVGVFFVNNMFVLICSYFSKLKLYTSTNGTTWTKKYETENSNIQNPALISYKDGRYIIIDDNSGNTKTVYYSSDLITWNRLTNIPASLLTSNCYVVNIVTDEEKFYLILSTGTILQSTDGTSWSVYSSIPLESSEKLAFFDYVNNKYIATLDSSSIKKLYVSETLLGEWEVINTTTLVDDKKIYFNNQYIDYSTPTSLYSTDLIEWKFATSTSSSYIDTFSSFIELDGIYNNSGVNESKLFNINNKRIIITDWKKGGKVRVLTTTDDINWTNNIITLNSEHGLFYVKNMICKDNLIIAINDSGYVMTSEDGLNWTTPSVNEKIVSLSGSSLRVKQFTNKYIINKLNSNEILISEDGINWSDKIITRDTSTIKTIYTFNNNFYVVYNDQKTYISEDCINWEEIGSSSYIGGDFYARYYEYNNKIIVLWNNYSYISEDGITWNTYSGISSPFSTYIFLYNNKMYKIYEGGIYETSDLDNWTAIINVEKGSYHCKGMYYIQNKRLIYIKDVEELHNSYHGYNKFYRWKTQVYEYNLNDVLCTTTEDLSVGLPLYNTDGTSAEKTISEVLSSTSFEAE